MNYIASNGIVAAGQVVRFRDGQEFLVVSTRGSKNVKARKLEGDSFSTGLYGVPRSGIKEVRSLTDHENLMLKMDEKDTAALTVGSVVQMKDGAPTRYVAIKINEGTVNMALLGGEDGKFYRNVPKAQLTVVNLDD